jgi:hypothetical protein
VAETYGSSAAATPDTHVSDCVKWLNRRYGAQNELWVMRLNIASCAAWVGPQCPATLARYAKSWADWQDITAAHPCPGI